MFLADWDLKSKENMFHFNAWVDEERCKYQANLELWVMDDKLMNEAFRELIEKKGYKTTPEDETLRSAHSIYTNKERKSELIIPNNRTLKENKRCYNICMTPILRGELKSFPNEEELKKIDLECQVDAILENQDPNYTSLMGEFIKLMTCIKNQRTIVNDTNTFSNGIYGLFNSIDDTLNVIKDGYDFGELYSYLIRKLDDVQLYIIKDNVNAIEIYD